MGPGRCLIKIQSLTSFLLWSRATMKVCQSISSSRFIDTVNFGITPCRQLLPHFKLLLLWSQPRKCQRSKIIFWCIFGFRLWIDLFQVLFHHNRFFCPMFYVKMSLWDGLRFTSTACSLLLACNSLWKGKACKNNQIWIWHWCDIVLCLIQINVYTHTEYI